MRRLRAALSRRLLSYGATVAADREQMWRSARKAGDLHRLAPVDYQLLGALDFASTMALRLGLFLMPAEPLPLPAKETTLR